tara:strand:- start:111 stop:386 length:276 start_codon:yes stop_codon:yes gene_type:complete
MNFSDSYAPFANHNDLLLKVEDVKSSNYGKRFNQDSRLITNNDISLTGVGVNRWEPLFFNPQKNCIENFRRGGENSVLNTLDTYLKKGNTL